MKILGRSALGYRVSNVLGGCLFESGTWPIEANYHS